jgi:hypothetical protein
MAKQSPLSLQSRKPPRDGEPSTFRAACVAVAVVLAGAAIYAVVIRYNPFVVLSFFGTVIFGLLIGVEVSTTWPTRATAFKVVAALLLAVLGLWAYWLTWVALTVEHGAMTALQLAQSGPLHWANFIDRLAHAYHFSLRRKLGGYAEASTLETEIAWVIEALLVMALAVFAGISKPVYRKWTIEVWSAGLSSAKLREALARGDVSLLHSHEWYPAPELLLQPVWQSYEVAFDDRPRAISIVMVDHRPANSGEIRHTRTPLVDGLSLPYRDYKALAEHLSANMGRKD